MSFKSTFFVEDEEFNVLECDYTISQSTDHKGKPSARPKAGKVRILVEASKDNFLAAWATSETQVKSGKVVFYKRDSMAKMKEIIFTDAYCVHHNEHFSAKGRAPMQIQIIISARELSFGGSSGHKNTWS